MITLNLWTKVGIVNGATGFVRAIIYKAGIKPPELPLYVIVKLDKYNGPSCCAEPNCVPIEPFTANWKNGLYNMRQLPLMLCYALTIHKSQGMTIKRAVIHVGKSAKYATAFVGLSRLKSLSTALVVPRSYERYTKVYSSETFKERLREDKRLDSLCNRTCAEYFGENVNEQKNSGTIENHATNEFDEDEAKINIEQNAVETMNLNVTQDDEDGDVEVFDID